MGGVLKGIGDAIGDVAKGAGDAKASVKLPKEVTNVEAALKSADPEYRKLRAAMDVISDPLQDVIGAGGTISGLVGKALGVVAKDSFGLDPKKPEDKKKIDLIRKQLGAALEDVQERVDKEVDSLDKLNVVVAKSGKSKGLA